MSKRLDEVRERLANLEKLRVEALDKRGNKKYIEDLELSIEGCKRQLGFLEKHPDGVEFVNGV